MVAGPSPAPAAADYVVGSGTDGAYFDPTYPPYLPGRLGGAVQIDQNTVSFSALHYQGTHYDLHNMYGFSEGVATAGAMQAITNERSLVISRSTFSGSGTHNGHWLGDNESTWPDLYYSIPGVLTFNMFGIPLVGADVCGFGGPATTPELCTRWMQLGAFTYGFYRNHNTIGKAEQAPSVFPDPYRSYMRAALNGRLALMPYIFSLFSRAHANGTTVTRPLFFEFPTDAALPALDTQVMFGPALMVAPVLTENATTVSAYFPAAVWYEWLNGSALASPGGTYVTLPAPLSYIPVYIRGGYVVPTQDPNMTTLFSAVNPIRLTVAPGANGSAAGEIWYDDGVTINAYETGQYTLVTYAATATSSASGSSGSLANAVLVSGFTPAPTATLQSVRVLGVNAWSSASGKATVNGAAASSVSYDPVNGVLTIGFNVPLTAALNIQWSG
jgi:alpha-glucosidase (family GH31 glycosyl hydrolase)